MDQTTIVITKVRTLALPKLEIETNEPKKYIVDFSGFESVYCFPRSQADWENISITEQGFNLTWGTRFEVHVDQVIDSAEATMILKQHA